MRVNLNVPDELVKRLDDYAKTNYTSRSTVMCQACDQFLMAKEIQSLLLEMKKVMKNIADTSTITDEQMKELSEFGKLCDMFYDKS